MFLTSLFSSSLSFLFVVVVVAVILSYVGGGAVCHPSLPLTAAAHRCRFNHSLVRGACVNDAVLPPLRFSYFLFFFSFFIALLLLFIYLFIYYECKTRWTWSIMAMQNACTCIIVILMCSNVMSCNACYIMSCHGSNWSGVWLLTGPTPSLDAKLISPINEGVKEPLALLPLFVTFFFSILIYLISYLLLIKSIINMLLWVSNIAYVQNKISVHVLLLTKFTSVYLTLSFEQSLNFFFPLELKFYIFDTKSGNLLN